MTAVLERRYRRLLRCYPERHRRLYEAEMLAVLLAGARPGQRYPGLRETADLLRSALAARLTAVVVGLGGRRWGEAAAAMGVLAPALLFEISVLPTVSDAAWSLREGGEAPFPGFGPSVTGWVVAMGWLAVLGCSLVGWRILAAALAWIVVLITTAELSLRYATQPVAVLSALASLTLALVAAAALSLTAARRAIGLGRSGVRVMGRRSVVAFAASFLLALGCTAADPYFTSIVYDDAGSGVAIDHWWGANIPVVPLRINSGIVGLVTEIGYLVAAMAALLGLRWLMPPVRRRVLAMMAPAASLLVLIWVAFNGYAQSSVRFSPPVMLVSGQWIALAVTPMLAAALAVRWVHRAERRDQLIRLGRRVASRSG